MVADVNEFEQFDLVAKQILNTFEPLIQQLIARRDALLRKLQDMKEDYLRKESTRKAAREELLATQLHLQELSLKVNENKQYHQQATDIYKLKNWPGQPRKLIRHESDKFRQRTGLRTKTFISGYN